MADEHRPKDPRDPSMTRRDDAASRRDEKDREPDRRKKDAIDHRLTPIEIRGTVARRRVDH
jgi:hypothetical protein